MKKVKVQGMLTVLLSVMAAAVVGCGNRNIDNTTVEQNESGIQDSISYDEHSGGWFYEGENAGTDFDRGICS